MGHEDGARGLEFEATLLFKGEVSHHLVEAVAEVECVFLRVWGYLAYPIKTDLVAMAIIIQRELDRLILDSSVEYS